MGEFRTLTFGRGPGIFHRIQGSSDHLWGREEEADYVGNGMWELRALAQARPPRGLSVLCSNGGWERVIKEYSPAS